MFKKFSTISLATLATLGALAMSVESASAKSRAHISIGFHGGYHGHHWNRPYGWGFYGAPVYVSRSRYVLDSYYVRRSGRLFKVCE